MKFILILILASTEIFASQISLDIGNTSSVFNRISIPKSNMDQLTLTRDEAASAYRVTGFIDIPSGNQLYFLYAPLELEYDFTSTKNFQFNQTEFSAGAVTSLRYKFNSYRLGYLWTWNVGQLRYWTGIVGKIRDADTEVTQGSLQDSYDNIGFVPLASVGFDWSMVGRLGWFFHADALAARQGSAYDCQLELRYKLQRLSAALGKRILGGGADNDRVYNFAQFDTIYGKLSFLF